MKKFLRAMALLMLFACIPGLIAGCGKKGSADPVDDGYIYVPNIRSIALGTNETADMLRLENGKIYFSVLTHDKDYNITSLKVHSEDKDGGNVSETELKAPFDKEEYFQSILYGSDEIKLITVRYTNDDTAEYTIKTFDSNGSCVSSVPLDELNAEKLQYLNPCGTDAEGNFLFAGDSSVYKVSGEGKILDKIKNDDFILEPFTDNSGNMYVKCFSSTDTVVKKVDFNAKKISETLKGVPDEVGRMFDIGNGKFLLFASDWLYEYDTATGDCEKIVKYLDIDMPAPSPDAAWINDDGSIAFIYTDWSNPSAVPECVTLRKEVKTADSQKNILVLATGFADDGLKNAVMSYNRSNGDYRIEIREYTDEKTWEVDTDRLKADLSAGQIDILGTDEMGDAFKPEDYTDLYRYLDEDADIDLSDYFENVFKASEYKGKLYSVPTSFSSRGIVVNKKYFDGDSWTYDDFIKLMADNPSKKVLPYYLSSEFLYNCIVFGGDRFVDYDNAKCDLDCEEFIKLMELAKNQLKDMKELEKFDIFASLQKEETILIEMNVNDFMEVQLYNKILGDAFNPVGYPGPDHSSFSVVPDNCFAIPGNSKNKDGAWQFIRTLLLDKYQGSHNIMGFPVKKQFFEKQIESLLNEGSSMGGSVMTGDTVIELGSPTTEEIMLTKELVERADMYMQRDNGIYNIIAEEYESYAKGDKSAAEVAGIIQSRVSIYLAEQYG